MKSPIEILHEITRLSQLKCALHEMEPCSHGYVHPNLIKERLEAKLEALEWVLSEKP